MKHLIMRKECLNVHYLQNMNFKETKKGYNHIKNVYEKSYIFFLCLLYCSPCYSFKHSYKSF